MPCSILRLDLSGVFDIEYSALQMMIQCDQRLAEQGVDLSLAGCQRRPGAGEFRRVGDHRRVPIRPGAAAGDRHQNFCSSDCQRSGSRIRGSCGRDNSQLARGVIGVALLQTLLAGLVFSIFGPPAASVLTFVVLILCIVQIGPAPILFPVIVWTWMATDPVSALILTVLLIPIGLIDNVIKPILVAHGLSTPMLVILLGVLGGTLSYGLIGLFLGPIVLSVFYDLLVAWVRVTPSTENASNSEPHAPDSPIT